MNNKKAGIELHNGDCLEIMKSIPDKSVDLILTDPPYGATKNKWDSIIPLDLMWEQLNRIIKPNGAIILFGQDKFSAKLMLSQEKIHRYNLIWKKGERGSGFLNANKMPLRNHEDILVFYHKTPTYNPQYVKGKPNHSQGTKFLEKENTNNNYGKMIAVKNKLDGLKHPKSILVFDRPHPPIHPTQKPVELLEWLIKTYTIENETVLDFTMGSGSTGVACKNLDRNFIGIEMDKEYFKLASERINDHIVKSSTNEKKAA